MRQPLQLPRQLNQRLLAALGSCPWHICQSSMPILWNTSMYQRPVGSTPLGCASSLPWQRIASSRSWGRTPDSGHQDSGIRVLDREAIWLTRDTVPAALEEVFDVSARLGATNLLVVGNDPD